MQSYIYLDYHATTPLDPLILEKMTPYFTQHYANASGSHVAAWQANEAIEGARDQQAKMIGAQKKEIYFTSSASEANSWVFKTVADQYMSEKRNKILISPIEHKSVVNAAKYHADKCSVETLKVDSNGLLDFNDLETKLKNKDVLLVSVMHANNEIGTIQDIEKIGQLCKDYDCFFHSDCVQTFAKYPIDVEKANLHFATWSAHKFYGPKGVGAAYIRDGIQISPLIVGGGHERGLRAGTQNTPGIVGMAAASEICLDLHKEESTRIRGLRDQLQEGLEQILNRFEIQYQFNNNNKAHKLYYNLSLSLKNYPLFMKQSQLRRLCYSSGSSCNSGSGEVSHVLSAIGLDKDTASNTMRLSLGRMTTKLEIDQALDIFEKAFRPR